MFELWSIKCPRFALLTLLFALALPGSGWAVQVTISWNPNPPEEQVKRYVVFFGPTTRTSPQFEGYPGSVDVGKVTRCTVDLPVGTRCVAVAAYNVYGLRSDYSTELQVGYPIAASAGAGGTITPAGTVVVPLGAGQTFAVAPASHYAIADVSVDGVSVGPAASYTFAPVTSAHRIAATFKLVNSRGRAPAAVAGPIRARAEELVDGTTRAADAARSPVEGAPPAGTVESTEGADGAAHGRGTANAPEADVRECDDALASAPEFPPMWASLAAAPSFAVRNSPAAKPSAVEFQLAGDPSMAVPRAQARVSAGADGLTTWQPEGGLEPGIYFWRVRATDGGAVSAWSEPAAFRIAPEQPETEAVLEACAYLPAASGISLETEGGVLLEVEPGGLARDRVLTIASVVGTPAPQEGVELFGQVYEFGPRGYALEGLVTVALPYAEELLVEARLGPSELQVLALDPSGLTWVPVPVEAVDDCAHRLIIRTDRLATFAVGVGARE